ncbi:MarR family winged helix-turn-helix transcriptional regulator [Streptomyces anulatus]|uniref:MarR family winged helix-turn-helix transcriptional regulator n=1 Tax=Streptomyces anulatus TaxID=1892 RepID=UPI003B7FD4BE
MNATAENEPRPDLAAMVVPLGRALMAAEQPVLDAHGLSMWGYVVLSALGETPLRTQAALAAAINADKTRIITVLDDLESSHLLVRRPDPKDRRARLLSLTSEGRRLRDAVRDEIQRGEEVWLGQLADIDRESFLRSLRTLADAIRRSPDR